MNKTMTISVTQEFLTIIEKLAKETGLKKSTIIKLAVDEWRKKYEA